MCGMDDVEEQEEKKKFQKCLDKKKKINTYKDLFFKKRFFLGWTCINVTTNTAG